MDFQGTPLNMTELLIAILAAVAVFMLMRKKYDSNLPLLFYFFALLFFNLSDREVNQYLMYSGLAFALLLRFEFMNQGFAKIVSFFAGSSLCLIIYVMMHEIFGDGTAPF
jgi:predicted membrane protein